MVYDESFTIDFSSSDYMFNNVCISYHVNSDGPGFNGYNSNVSDKKYTCLLKKANSLRTLKLDFECNIIQFLTRLNNKEFVIHTLELWKS